MTALPDPEAPVIVVVGYDGSPAAADALHHAARRVGRTGRLFVVHAVEAPPESAGYGRADHRMAAEMREATDLLDRLEHDEGPSLEGVRWEWELLAGDPADAILRVAEARHADEIVVGTRGLGRARELLGTVAHALVRRSDRPVVVIPAHAARPAPHEPVPR